MGSESWPDVAAAADVIALFVSALVLVWLVAWRGVGLRLLFVWLVLLIVMVGLFVFTNLVAFGLVRLPVGVASASFGWFYETSPWMVASVRGVMGGA